MKKAKMQKGITLIALIITIVVLLIIAVIAIGEVQESGIIAHAQNAASGYNQGKANEGSTILGYEELIENVMDGIDKAQVGEIVKTNSTIDGKMYNSTNPIIPAGFAAINITGTNASSWDAEAGPEVNKGLVITDNTTKDEAGNTIGSEFVWVPVAQINDMIMCQEHGASETLDEETLQCPICGENTKLAGKLYSIEIGNNFSSATTGQIYGKNTGFREPDVVTGASGKDSTAGTNYDYKYLSTVLEGEYTKEQTAASFKAQLQNEFDNMAKSVAKYGGFYVGRYETSLTEGKTAQSKYGEISTNVSQTDTYMWYGLYTKSKTYISTKKSVQSTMIWGSQYDSMMRWMENNGVNVNTDIGELRNTERTCGTTPEDVIKNVYDLYGNSYEWILLTSDSQYRVIRSGDCNNSKSPSNYSRYEPSHYGRDSGSRLALYIV